MDERTGHEDGSVQSRYDPITAGMRKALMSALTEMGEQALEARRAMSHGSPVAVLDPLLKAASSTLRGLPVNAPNPQPGAVPPAVPVLTQILEVVAASPLGPIELAGRAVDGPAFSSGGGRAVSGRGRS